MARLTEEDKQRMMEEAATVALRAVRKAKRKAPVDTGRLRASITAADSEGLIQSPGGEAMPGDSVDRPNDDYVIRVGTNVEYAAYVEFGAAPHLIAPDDAEALHWESSEGGDAFAAKVMHPGTEPRPFLRPAVDEALNEAGVR